MAQDTIDRVREAERLAEALEQKSREQAKRIVDGAQIQAQEIFAQAKRQAQARREEKLRVAQLQAEQLLSQAKEDAKREADGLRAQAQQKKQETLRMILQKVL